MDTAADLTHILSLKRLKEEGILDLKELNLLDFRYASSANEEIRLQTLELIVTSKKSTQYFSDRNLFFILCFLKFNIGEKMEFVPLIKKALKRLNDSYAVIKRQLEKEEKLKCTPTLSIEYNMPKNKASKLRYFYQEFVRYLFITCFTNVYPGAVNVRRKSSLQILCLIEELLCEDLKEDLKCNLWKVELFDTILDWLALDTYEGNKEMAFNLIKSSNLIGSYYKTERKVLELVNTALQMGNSIRPLDSITAAYMLKISMLSPLIDEVLLTLINEEKIDCKVEKTSFYMIMLLKKCLEEPVELAARNIVVAASKHSLYGYIYCIRSILSDLNLQFIRDECWKNIISDLINMCFKLNTSVSQIVNNSSPEGHLPMDLNPRHLEGMVEDVEDVIITPQMVLLCSWRTVKEISLLFGHITCHASIFNEETNDGLLKEKQFKEIGDVLVTLLFETKHRGAFEQAHVGFGQLCSRLWHVEQKFLKQLPKMWLQQLMLAVGGLTSENSKLCATRRSAGVPFMVQALVTSEIKKRCDTQSLIFHSVMRILLKLSNINDCFSLNDAENLIFNESLFSEYDKVQYYNDVDKSCIKLNELTEIKTHSLNILRALYRHCMLGDLVKDYIAEGFITAFKSYDGKSWAERNAATLLFSSLVVRVFGVQRTKDHMNLTLHNKMTGRNFFEKFPTLLPFLLQELTIFVDQSEDQIKPKIQSILLILSRLYQSVTSESADEDWKINQFIRLVCKCGKSRVYKTRELAARALVPLLTEVNLVPISCDLLISAATGQLPLNLLHGYTLQLLELVRNQRFNKVQLPREPFQTYIKFLNTKIFHNLESTNDGAACFPVATGALEIFIELSKIELHSWVFKDSSFLNLLEKIQSHLTIKNLLKKRPGIELYESTAANLLFITLRNVNFNGPLVYDGSTQFWKKILTHKNIDVLRMAWTKFFIAAHKMNTPSLYDLGYVIAELLAVDNPIRDSDLQNIVYQFLHDTIKHMEENRDNILYPVSASKEDQKMSMCVLILVHLSQQLELETYYSRREFFILFGKAFAFLLKNLKDSEIPEKFKITIYDVFLNQSNMESNLDCRLGISEGLYDIYLDSDKQDDIYFILNWWTTLLNLLYDDNSQIRLNASKIVSKINPEAESCCEEMLVDKFFDTFGLTVKKHLDALSAALFCWCMSSADTILEEMDETDVFNKSCNYERFEPLQIASKSCACYKSIMKGKWRGHKDIPPVSRIVKQWVRKQLDLPDEFDFNTVDELVIKYKEFIPSTEKSLNKILDPIYPARLIKETAYVDFHRTLMNEDKKLNFLQLFPDNLDFYSYITNFIYQNNLDVHTCW